MRLSKKKNLKITNVKYVSQLHLNPFNVEALAIKNFVPNVYLIGKCSKTDVL